MPHSSIIPPRVSLADLCLFLFVAILFCGSNFAHCGSPVIRHAKGRVASSKDGAFTLVVLTYDRVDSLRRLFDSLLETDYLGHTINLRVCVDQFPDGSHHAPTVKFFSRPDLLWPHGLFEVILWDEKKFLVGQWHSCWDPGPEVLYNDRLLDVAYLEDDLVLSPFFYRWIQASERRIGLSYASLPISEITLQRTTFSFTRGLKEATVPFSVRSWVFPSGGSWGHVPITRDWAEYLGWQREKAADKSFHPYVDGFIPSDWWRDFEKTGKTKGMWTMWQIRYKFDHNKTAICPWPPKGTTLSQNMREKGVNTGSGLSADYPRWLRFEPEMLVLPERPLVVGWDGTYSAEQIADHDVSFAAGVAEDLIRNSDSSSRSRLWVTFADEKRLPMVVDSVKKIAHMRMRMSMPMPILVVCHDEVCLNGMMDFRAENENENENELGGLRVVGQFLAPKWFGKKEGLPKFDDDELMMLWSQEDESSLPRDAPHAALVRLHVQMLRELIGSPLVQEVVIFPPELRWGVDKNEPSADSPPLLWLLDSDQLEGFPTSAMIDSQSRMHSRYWDMSKVFAVFKVGSQVDGGDDEEEQEVLLPMPTPTPTPTPTPGPTQPSVPSDPTGDTSIPPLPDPSTGGDDASPMLLLLWLGFVIHFAVSLLAPGSIFRPVLPSLLLMHHRMNRNDTSPSSAAVSPLPEAEMRPTSVSMSVLSSLFLSSRVALLTSLGFFLSKSSLGARWACVFAVLAQGVVLVRLVIVGSSEESNLRATANRRRTALFARIAFVVGVAVGFIFFLGVIPLLLWLAVAIATVGFRVSTLSRPEPSVWTRIECSTLVVCSLVVLVGYQATFGSLRFSHLQTLRFEAWIAVVCCVDAVSSVVVGVLRHFCCVSKPARVFSGA